MELNPNLYSIPFPDLLTSAPHPHGHTRDPHPVFPEHHLCPFLPWALLSLLPEPAVIPFPVPTTPDLLYGLLGFLQVLESCISSQEFSWLPWAQFSHPLSIFPYKLITCTSAPGLSLSITLFVHESVSLARLWLRYWVSSLLISGLSGTTQSTVLRRILRPYRSSQGECWMQISQGQGPSLTFILWYF